MNPIRIGIIGCGNVLGAYRAAIIQAEASRARRSHARLRPRVAARRRARRAGPVPFTTDAGEVIASPRVDPPIILTSMSEHARLARSALGRKTSFSKPIATSLEDASGLVELSKRAPGHLCAPFTLSPTFQVTRAFAAATSRQGLLGASALRLVGPYWTGGSTSTEADASSTSASIASRASPA